MNSYKLRIFCYEAVNKYEVKNENPDEVIDEIIFFLNSQNNNRLFISIDEKNNLKKLVLPFYNISYKQDGAQGESLKSMIQTNTTISNELATKIISINPESSYTEINTKINEIKNTTPIDANEMNHLETMRSVAEYSDYYWANGTGGNDDPPLFWDALGALIGLWASPAWSIIQGALASYIMGPVVYTPPVNVQP